MLSTRFLKRIFVLLLCFLPILALAGASDFTNNEDDFLSPDVAFKLDLTILNSQKIAANFKVADGYYLYKQRISFKDATGKVISANLPAGDMKDDPNFGAQEVYHHDFVGEISLDSTTSPVEITAKYQGCSEKGLCYAPITKKISLDLPTNNTNDEDKLLRALNSGHFWPVIIAAFLLGLLLSFTPCVLPMMPILSSIIIGSQAKMDKPNKLHAFGLSVAYVLGMAFSYTLAGIAAGLSGNLLSQSLQNPWVLSFTALLLIVLALGMFGLYEFKLPSVIEDKILNMSNRQKSGSFIGVFVMGAIAILILSPCVAPALVAILVFISKKGDVLLGGTALFFLSIGMGVPLLLIGASAGSILPKAGSWMTAIRNLFGVLLVAMAAYTVWPILPSQLKQPTSQILGLQTKSHLPFQRVKSVGELDAAIANANGKPVMLDFYADWCVACKEMEKFTFSDAGIQTALNNTVLLQADVTDNNADDQALLKRFSLFGPPGIIFFNTAGQDIKPHVIGYKNVAEFSKILNQNTQ